MSKGEIHPELQLTFKKVPPVPFGRKATLPIANIIMNIISTTRCVSGVIATTQRLDGKRIRIYTPENRLAGPGILWIHGGGHVAGRPENLNRVASKFAKTLDAVVIAPQYRLAPKHPFPADLDDCYAAWTWLLKHAASLNIDPNRIAVVGNSAGGGLAAALVNKIKDTGGFQPAAQILFYPMLDDRTVLNPEIGEDDHWVWNQRFNRVAWSSYLSPDTIGADTISEYAAPARREDLSDLPPCWIGAGDIDLFYLENKIYAERLAKAGNDCEFIVVPDAPHAFEGIAPSAPVSKTFLKSAERFLDKYL